MFRRLWEKVFGPEVGEGPWPALPEDARYYFERSDAVRGACGFRWSPPASKPTSGPSVRRRCRSTSDACSGGHIRERLRPLVLRGTAPRRGFSFAAGCALIARMDPDLENVIRQALGVAKAAGRDDMGQTMLAVQAVQQARTPVARRSPRRSAPPKAGSAQTGSGRRSLAPRFPY